MKISFKNLTTRLNEFISPILSNIVNWRTISFFGKSKIIQRSYIYLFLVPFAANLLSAINSPLIIEIGGTPLAFNIDLPFSWKLFFWSALCFTIGNIIYKIWAPSIIKDNKSFGDFQNDRKNLTHVIDYRDNLGISEKFLNKYGFSINDYTLKGTNYITESISKNPKIKNKVKDKIYERLDIYTTTQEYMMEYSQRYEHQSAFEAQFQKPVAHTTILESAFWDVYEYAQFKSNLMAMRFVLLFNTIGIILISIVLIQCVWAVYSFGF